MLHFQFFAVGKEVLTGQRGHTSADLAGQIGVDVAVAPEDIASSVVVSTEKSVEPVPLGISADNPLSVQDGSCAAFIIISS